MEAKHTATPNLPEPYVEVFIWWRGARRVARLDASKKHFQLATFLADTKGQYLASVEEVERWSPIAEGNAHDGLVGALQRLEQEGWLSYIETQARSVVGASALRESIMETVSIARAALSKAAAT